MVMSLPSSVPEVMSIDQNKLLHYLFIKSNIDLTCCPKFQFVFYVQLYICIYSPISYAK